MFLNLLKFELQLHIRKVGFWVSFALVVIAAIALSSLDFLGSSGGERIKSNGAIPGLLARGCAVFFVLVALCLDV